MVSSGSVAAVSSELSSLFSNYNSYVSEVNGSWEGSSYDNFVAKTEEFTGEYEGAIASQIESFSEAISLYEQYISIKDKIKTTESSLSAAEQNEDGKLVNLLVSELSKLKDELEKLKASINSALESASSPVFESSSSSTGEFVNYYQTDYSDVPYSDFGTIATYGCGPTSLAMVLTYLLDEEITPVETAQKGYNSEVNYTCKKGTYFSYFGAMADEYQVECNQMNTTESNIIDNLNDGKTLILSMSKGHFTKSGHFIVVRGLDDDGKAVVADPASKDRSAQTWDVDLLANESGQMWALDNY